MAFVKNSLYYCLLFVLFISCRSTNNLDRPENAFIVISSVLSEEVCTLWLNESLEFEDRPIVADRSLGADLNSTVNLSLESRVFRVRMECKGNLVGEDAALSPIIRKVELDTILNIKHGKYFLINVRDKSIQVGYSRKPIKLD